MQFLKNKQIPCVVNLLILIVLSFIRLFVIIMFLISRAEAKELIKQWVEEGENGEEEVSEEQNEEGSVEA